MFLALFSLVGCLEYNFEAAGPPFVEPVDTSVPDVVDVIDETVAKAPVYANTATELFDVDPQTGARTSHGLFHDYNGPVENFVDIAIDLDGHMYGGTYDALYKIFPQTAQVELICYTDLQMYALAFTSDGTLFAGAGEEVTRVDLDTCQGSPLFSFSPFETSGDLVGLPDGYLYWTVRGPDGDQLVKVNPNTGSTEYIGDIFWDRLYGLGYDNGELFGFSGHGEIVRISPVGAASQLLASEETISWWGATTNPVVW